MIKIKRRGNCYQLKPKDEAHNTSRDLEYSGYHEKPISVLLYIVENLNMNINYIQFKSEIN
jgi:hypothetical protein